MGEYEYMRKRSELSEEEKRQIARKMIEGYKKMGPLNRELAQKVNVKSGNKSGGQA